MTTNQIEIKFTCEASPILTEQRIKRAVAVALNTGSDHYTPEWVEPVIVTEGSEKCGYGTLHVSGTVKHWNGFTTVTYMITNRGSKWKNYGHPSGTKHDVSITLEPAAL